MNYIDTYEFLCCLIFLSSEDFKTKSDMLFELYDTNGDRVLDIEEATVLIKCIFGALSIVDDEAMTTDEEIQESLLEFFERTDSNNDNLITKSEWQQYLKQEKGILSSLARTGIAETNPLGKDFGRVEVEHKDGVIWIPLYDDDLEAECDPKANRDKNKE